MYIDTLSSYKIGKVLNALPNQEFCRPLEKNITALDEVPVKCQDLIIHIQLLSPKLNMGVGHNL